MSQTRSDSPYRPGSGIFPPMLSGRERDTAAFAARLARTREGQPQHTALLGDWAIGQTTLLMHWRRLRQHAGHAVVLSMAYPQPKDEFLGAFGWGGRGRVDTDWRERLDLEIGLDIGIADARLRRSRQTVESGIVARIHDDVAGDPGIASRLLTVRYGILALEAYRRWAAEALDVLAARLTMGRDAPNLPAPDTIGTRPYERWSRGPAVTSRVIGLGARIINAADWRSLTFNDDPRC